MSRSIDERIVEMQFNNRQFESGVKESLGSLDRLKKGLDLDGASKSLAGLSDAGKRFSLAGIAEGVDVITERFSTLGIIGITAIQNITNRVTDLGIQMAKSLSIDQISAGWSKYEEKTSSVQTIMNATGKSIDEVNGYLDKLMWFSDETSYGFTDMTKALSQMTSSGGNIDNLIPLITGVANATAYAGKGAAEFSRAMYNLNQSYGSGNLQYMDWRSLELAGVASQQLKEIFIDTGIALGKLDKNARTAKGELVTIGSFGTTLKDKWADTAVMEAAFGKFSELSEAAYELVQAGQFDTASEAMAHLSGKYSEIAEKAFKSAQQAKTFTEAIDATKDAVSSGWMNTFEIIFGNFEEATVFWTDVTNKLWEVFASGAESRNEILQEWKELGGRDAIIESFWNLVDAIEAVTAPIKEAFRELFPSTTAEKLISITESIKNFTERLKIGDETADKLKRTFKGVFAVFDIVKQGLSAISNGIGIFIRALSPGANSLLDFTAGIGDWLVSLDEAVKKSDIFNKTIQKVVRGVEWVADKIRISVGAIRDFVNENETFRKALEKISNVTEKVKEKVGNGVTAIIGFFKEFKTADLSGAETFAEKIRVRFEPFSAMFEIIGKVFKNTVEILKKVAPIFYKLAEMIGKGLMNLQEKILGALDKGEFSSILDLFNTGMLGALIIGIKKFISSMSEVTGGFSGILDGVRGSLEAWQTSLKAGVLLKIATAVVMLAGALVVLAMIESDKLAAALAAITTLFAELVGTMTVFSKLIGGDGSKALKKLPTMMIGISAAVLILSFAMSKIAKLDWEGVEKGLIAIGGLMAMLVASAKVLSKNEGSMIKGATGLILFAVAINILATAVKKLGGIDIASLGKGLLAVGILMTELALFMKATDLNKMGVGKATGILLLATAMVILSTAVEKLGKLDLVNLAKGIAAIGILLLELGLFINATPDAKKVISTAIGMTILGAAMLIFGSAIGKMGAMPIEQIGKGLITMAGTLVIIAGAMSLMPPNMLVSATSLVIVAAALLILSNALTSMGKMTWDEIGRGLVVLAGSLIIIAGAMMLMTTALPGAAALLLIAGALAILAPVLKTLGSMSLSEIGKGLLALAGVFAVIGVAGLLLGPLTPVILGLAAAIVLFGIGCLAVGAGVLAFSAGLTALAVAGTAGTAALVAIVTAIIGLIPMLLEQVGYAIIAFAGVITEGMPAIMEAIEALFAGLIKLLGDLTPPLIRTVLEFILELLLRLVEYIPQFVDAGMKIIIGFLKGISDNMEEVVATAIDIVLNFINGIISKLPDIIDTAYKLIISFINGLADAIRNNHNAIYDAVENLIRAIIEAFVSFFGRIKKVGGEIVSGLIEGIVGMAKSLVDAVKGVVTGAIDGAKKLLGIKSPSKVFEEIGKNTGRGMVVGLEGMSGKVAAASEDLGNSAVNGMSDALAHVQDVLDSDVELQPTIRPVVDMTEVESGMKNIFDRKRGISVTEAMDKATLVNSRTSVRTLASDSITPNKKSGEKVIHNAFNISSLVVREEADVKRVARKLYQMQLATDRG